MSQYLKFLSVIFAVLACSTALAESPVKAKLHIPPAETYVIGDVIPLIWQFQNTTNEPLGFMWEGCCRLNGRLDVTSNGKALELVPPAQTLAHMFAKAEKLDPGVVRGFDTRVSDWVALKESGSYELQGRYVGVLPTQKPQVPRGLQLWRDAATTGPIGLTVLSVDDYLKERDQRAEDRKIMMQLSGSYDLPPLKATPLELKISNLSGTEQKLSWPNDFQIWIVDANGRRLENVPTAIEAESQELILPPKSSVSRAIPFNSDFIEGQALGEYRLFIDLKSGPAKEPRVPSTVLPIRWDLEQSDVAQLITSATQEMKGRVRNAPLKLLRVYVAEIGPALHALDSKSLTPEAQTLVQQLHTASCLKPMAPKPGTVNWVVLANQKGSWIFQNDQLNQCLGNNKASDSNPLKTLLDARRHLGWEVTISVNPDAAIVMGDLIGIAGQIGKYEGLLAAPPNIIVTNAETKTTAVASLRKNLNPAGLIVRLTRGFAGPQIAAAHRKPDPNQPQLFSAFSPEEIRSTAVSPLQNGLQDLNRILEDSKNAQTALLVDPGLNWSDIVPTLQLFARRSMSIDLAGIEAERVRADSR